MRTFNTSLLCGLGCLLTLSALQADVAYFSSGSDTKLSGSLQAIDKDGIVEWQSPFASKPLKLLAAKLEQVEFSTTPETSDPAPIQISLRNGDVLPATRVAALDEAGMVTETPIAGVLTIPRSAIASAQFGITKKQIIYSGFQDIREWTSGLGNPENWKRRDNSLISNGRSIAARDCQLPENFALSFGIAWDTRAPSFSIGFADNLAKDSSKLDRYNFYFDVTGMRIVRHCPSEMNTRTLAQWKRRPSDFPNNNFKVELRVDRTKRLMELFIDGESEGIIVDQNGDQPMPSGSGISINCRTSSGNQTVSDMTITELHDTRTRHLAEKRGDPSLDCLITTEDDRWSGQLISMGGSPEEPFMIFKTNFANESWEIPEQEISTLFFANNPFKGGPGGEPVFTIEFHDSGKLSTINCTINGDQVEAVHPLLGTLQIKLSSIKLIRRIK